MKSMLQAAKAKYMQTCLMQTPGISPNPHVGGPVMPPGCVTVMMIGGMQLPVWENLTAHGGLLLLVALM